MQIITLIIVVLGCSMLDIQNNRVNAAIEYIQNTNQHHILFLTGGTKHNINDFSEASKMKSLITNNNIESNNIIIDDKAQNTAENFVNLKKWLQEKYNIKYTNKQNITETNNIYINPIMNLYNNEIKPKIVIATSAFHKNRAEKIFRGVFFDFQDIETEWVLGNAACNWCWNYENIHIKNVDNDVKKALSK